MSTLLETREQSWQPSNKLGLGEPMRYPSDEEILAADSSLDQASSSIILSRQMIRSWRTALTQAHMELTASRNAKNDLMDSYAIVQQSQVKTVDELQQLNHKYSELLRDWEQSCQLIQEYESVVKMYTYSSKCICEHKLQRPLHSELEARVQRLEKEKEDMVKEHQSALIVAADRIGAAEKKLDEMRSQNALDPTSPICAMALANLQLSPHDEPRTRVQKNRKRSRKTKQNF